MEAATQVCQLGRDKMRRITPFESQIKPLHLIGTMVVDHVFCVVMFCAQAVGQCQSDQSASVADILRAYGVARSQPDLGGRE